MLYENWKRCGRAEIVSNVINTRRAQSPRFFENANNAFKKNKIIERALTISEKHKFIINNDFKDVVANYEVNLTKTNNLVERITKLRKNTFKQIILWF